MRHKPAFVSPASRRVHSQRVGRSSRKDGSAASGLRRFGLALWGARAQREFHHAAMRPRLPRAGPLRGQAGAPAGRRRHPDGQDGRRRVRSLPRPFVLTLRRALDCVSTATVLSDGRDGPPRMSKNVRGTVPVPSSFSWARIACSASVCPRNRVPPVTRSPRGLSGVRVDVSPRGAAANRRCPRGIVAGALRRHRRDACRSANSKSPPRKALSSGVRFSRTRHTGCFPSRYGGTRTRTSSVTVRRRHDPPMALRAVAYEFVRVLYLEECCGRPVQLVLVLHVTTRKFLGLYGGGRRCGFTANSGRSAHAAFDPVRGVEEAVLLPRSLENGHCGGGVGQGGPQAVDAGPLRRCTRSRWLHGRCAAQRAAAADAAAGHASLCECKPFKAYATTLRGRGVAQPWRPPAPTWYNIIWLTNKGHARRGQPVRQPARVSGDVTNN